ncbi:SusC/RagA family TonB-linked outer membrane protein [Bacteroidia bacterium]|nr:SusC/RagA family TonB-linked outer membrane protein [Bacteroidia bacterium]
MRTKLKKTKRKTLLYKGINPISVFLFLFFCCSVSLFSQTGTKLKGTVLDGEGEPLIGATILIQGSGKGAVTDIEGRYELDNVPLDSKLLIKYLGMADKEIIYKGEKEINIVLESKANELEELEVVAFSRQKKGSVVASITTVKPSELKVPSSNLTTAFAGRVAGLISYQSSGEPGQDNASFFIRGITTFGASAKKNPLILIDGMELSSEELSRLNTDDIASFSVLKDASATALYGARGANGIIMVTTKEGHEGKVAVKARLESSFSSATEMIKTADPVTFMRMHNEAVKTRDPLGMAIYSEEKILMTERGLYPDQYPAVDWYNYMFEDVVNNYRANLSFSGGGSIARYYVAASIARDNGNIKVDKRNNFNSNISLVKYNIRSNVNVNLTKTTELINRLNVQFDDYTGPYSSGSEMYEMIMATNPVLFKPYYEPDEHYSYAKHILFGNSGSGTYLNPYAESLKGYRDYSKNTLLTQFELKQNLSMITDGLKVRALVNMDRYSEYNIYRQYQPFYYNISSYDKSTGDYKLTRLNTNGTENIDYLGSGLGVNTTFYLEAATDYNRTFNEKHGVSGLLVYTMRQYKVGAAPNLQLSLPNRNVGFAGRFAYNYDSRYFLELDFGYNGSERFATKKRYGFFPALAGGWMISSEQFFEKLKDFLPTLKLKGSYGISGQDAIGNDYDRFYYLSQVNLQGSREINWGTQMNYNPGGIIVSRYANDEIGWETAYIGNIGLEFQTKGGLNGNFEVYHQRRKNILIDRVIPSTMGILPEVKANLGVGESKGVDLELNYEKTVNKNLWLIGRGSFTFTRAKVLEWEEPDYSGTPWLSRVGKSPNQGWGYIAERLFIDDAEVANSPAQFGTYLAGDIKYRDVNRDGKISALDQVPIGYPTEPELNYGFGLTAGYKGFDLSVFFSGLGRKSFWINTFSTAPFVNSLWWNRDGNNAVLQYIADNYWSESNRNSYAFWPRLSTQYVTNNGQTSTWFMQDGSFLRLKTAELGYAIPAKILKKFNLSELRIYANGLNLYSWRTFKLWDPEMGGNGLGYPLQRVINFGISIGL